MKTYTTVSGDTWDKIALSELGSERYIVELMEANIEHASTVIFSSGIILNIPGITEQVSNNLPPWKRVDT